MLGPPPLQNRSELRGKEEGQCYTPVSISWRLGNAKCKHHMLSAWFSPSSPPEQSVPAPPECLRPEPSMTRAHWLRGQAHVFWIHVAKPQAKVAAYISKVGTEVGMDRGSYRDLKEWFHLLGSLQMYFCWVARTNNNIVCGHRCPGPLLNSHCVCPATDTCAFVGKKGRAVTSAQYKCSSVRVPAQARPPRWEPNTRSLWEAFL